MQTIAQPAPRSLTGYRVALYVLAYAATWAALLAPTLVALPLRVKQLAPTQTAQSLSLVLGVGALVALGSPAYGWLSDRTRGRTGSRRPWLLMGALLGVVGSLFMAAAESLVLLIAGWSLVQLGCNVLLVSLMAVLVDAVPARRRGRVSGVLGVGPPVGAVAGTWLLELVSGSHLLMFLAPAALAAGAVALFATVLPSAQPSGRRPRRGGAAASHDLRALSWAWLSRAAFFFGVVTIGNYQALYLIDGLGQRPADVPRLIASATLVHSVLLIGASLLAGHASDRTGRRKPFLVAAGLLFAAASAIVMTTTSIPLFVVGIGLAGLALGAYAAVDLALITDLLRSREADAAKGLGVFRVAGTLPQVLVPAMASVLLISGYPAVFAAASVFGVASAIAILCVRGTA